jgi:hypothetical protein
MARKRPKLRQRTVLYLEPAHGGALAGSLLFFVVTAAAAVALAVYGPRLTEQTGFDDDAPERFVLIATAVLSVFAVLALLSALYYARRWRTARAIERLSEDPDLVPLLPDHSPPALSPRADRIPPLQVTFVKPRKLPKPPPRQRVTPEHNVIGRRPLDIAYLRLFENQPRTRTFVEGAWREFGYAHLLRSADSVPPAELRARRKHGGLDALFIDRYDELEQALARRAGSVNPKGRYVFKAVTGTTIRTRDRYGSYPLRALLCHGQFWKAAVDVLLDRVDLVVLDLSGFTPRNRGTRYELQRVVDRFPVECVVFLADQHSDQRFLMEAITESWHAMAAGSPNAGTQARTAVVAVTDRFVSSSDSNSSTTRVQLVAYRPETRRLATMAQDRVEQARHRARATA